jgi:hypothetical protein
MPKPTLFSISIDGRDRLIFSIQERTSSGDLTLVMKQSLFYREDLTIPATDGDKIIEERYSIHRSTKSPIFNVLKFTKIMKDGRLQSPRNYTTAIKVHNQFAALFMKRAGDLSGERYDMPKQVERNISLGSYEPEHLQPTFLVLVGPKHRLFDMPLMRNTINHRQVQFEYFSIVILWQFFPFVDKITARSLTLETFSDEEIAMTPDNAEKMEKVREGLF